MGKARRRDRTVIVIAAASALGIAALWWAAMRGSGLDDEAMRRAAHEQADGCAQALLHHDYSAVVNKMPPDVLRQWGQADAFIKTMRDGDARDKLLGFSLQSVAIGQVTDLKRSESRAFAVVPETIDIAMPEGLLRTESYLLGVSGDGGRNWHFLDGAGLQKLGRIQSVFADFPPDLSLPAPPKPVTIRAMIRDPQSATRPTEELANLTVERAFYRVRVPAGSTIEGGESLDADHYAVVNLPDDTGGGGALIFRVVDDKADLDAVAEAVVDGVRKRLGDPVDTPTHDFNRLGGAGTVTTGRYFFIPHCFEVGHFAGKTKGYIVLMNYTKSDAAEAADLLHHVVESFQIKD